MPLPLRLGASGTAAPGCSFQLRTRRASLAGFPLPSLAHGSRPGQVSRSRDRSFFRRHRNRVSGAAGKPASDRRECGLAGVATTWQGSARTCDEGTSQYLGRVQLCGAMGMRSFLRRARRTVKTVRTGVIHLALVLLFPSDLFGQSVQADRLNGVWQGCDQGRYS
jgi:hypothetical protein